MVSPQGRPSTLTLPLAAVNEFWVTVQKTEAAERCKLQGMYVLKASWNELVLREAHSSLPLYTWPYRLLRRYGRDKVSLSGRRRAGPLGFCLIPPTPPRDLGSREKLDSLSQRNLSQHWLCEGRLVRGCPTCPGVVLADHRASLPYGR